MYLSTGDENIDIYLEGGIPTKSNVLLSSRPGIEKTILSLQFLWEGLKKGDKCIYVITDSTPSAIITIAKRFGWDLNIYLGTQLFFIDCYSWTLGQKGFVKAKGIIQVLGPTALNDISIELSKLIEDERRKRIIFHSLSTFLLNNPPETIFRFIQITGARLKSMNSTTIFLIDEGMHNEKIVSTLEHLMDDTIILKREETGWILMSKKSTYSKGLVVEFDEFGVRAE